MDQALRVSFNSPQSGFMSIGLENDQQSFVAAVSHEPYDSVRDLINALLALLDGAERATVKWNQEPEEYDFEFIRTDEQVQLSVIRYTDHHRLAEKREQVFSHTGSVRGLCLSFREVLRRLHLDRRTDEYAKNWRREFPAAEFLQLKRRIKALPPPMAYIVGGEIKG
ncbi:MAG: hypothetical protein JO360_06650 [Acidobacteria bacterium]|nr:hypothetical protein [Acidobacteriota bacterium]